jgi:hypothetical protein
MNLVTRIIVGMTLVTKLMIVIMMVYYLIDKLGD